jgi:hypothetical protein
MIEFIVKTHDGKLWDIGELVTRVSYNDRLNDGCSKLEFSYINDDLLIENGNEVRFTYDGSYIFVGRVFKVNRDKGKEISVTAYDQLRYAKAKDFFVTSEGETIASLITRMCTKYNFKMGTIVDVNYKLKANVYDGDTWLDIIYKAIKDTYLSAEKMYCLRDDFGYISLWNVDDLKSSLILGDGSLCYNYSYQKSIDENFYNQAIILAKGDINQFFSAKDDSSIKKYGMMQFYESSDKLNASQAQVLANAFLNSYNREAESLTLNCLGDVRVVAGVSFWVMIEDIIAGNMARRFIVRSVTHDYLPTHTMKIEVEI